MKQLLLFLISIIGLQLSAQTGLQTVNKVLGDESFVVLTGEQPTAASNEQLRITYHLLYVEQYLRTKETSHLTIEQQANRQKVLDLLREYFLAGSFPANYDYPGERKPCFIDQYGNICAVGYLIEKTVGRSIAENINQKHQYQFIADMNEPLVNAWASQYGLSLEECALIQPTYSEPPPRVNVAYADIKPNYGVWSGIFGGINIAFSALNLSNQHNSKAVARLGFVTGAGQIIMGVINIRKNQEFIGVNQSPYNISYKAQNNLSYMNLAMGTSTIVTGTINLLLRKNNKEKRTAVSIYSYPNSTNTLSTGFTITRRI